MTIEKPTFFAQLKQRHVFRVAAMYAVTAWLLVQVGSSTFEPLGFPGWSQRALIILIALGFPIALVLAWIFDVTPEGVVRGSTATPTNGLSRGRKLDIVIIVVLLAALAVTFLWRREPADTMPPPVADASIAVLAFDPIGADPALKPLGEGMAEQITNELAGRSELRVASRTSAFEVQGGKDAVSIAHTLGVSYVLEGSVRTADAHVRVTAQLVRGSDGVHVWSETYDIDADQTVEIDRTAISVTYQVISYVALEQDLQRARTQTRNQAAYDHYAAARQLPQTLGDPKGWDQILDDLDRAIALDPDFVPAHSFRASVYSSQLGYRACGPRCPAEARRSIARALALQPDNPDVLGQLAFLQLFFDLDPAAAQATLNRIRQIDPRNRDLNSRYALLAMFRGNLEDARDYLTRQIEIKPYSAGLYELSGWVLRSQGDFAAAERARDTAMHLSPRGGLDYLLAAVQRISLLIDHGDTEKARAMFEPLWAEYRYSNPYMFGAVLAQLGYRQEAKELAAQLEQNPESYPFNIFTTYFALGEYDRALIWLRRTIDERGVVLAYIRLPNQWPGLQQQPEYADAMKYLDSLQKSR